MTIDPRSARLLALVAWAGFFTWLWISGETVRYLGPRTSWVVPVGALTLIAASLAYARATPDEGRARVRLSLREGAGLAALVVPIVAAAILANAQLGSLAASNKFTSRGIDPSALANLASKSASDVSFLQIKAAQNHPSEASSFGVEPGRPVRLLGFVSRSPARAGGTFDLTRFYITCCVADAVPMGVTIHPGPTTAGARMRKDQWLEVTGSLARRRGRYVLVAERIRRTKAPSDPYLTFSS
jgi:putative membrane protein